MEKVQDHLYVLILAGGGGTRLWPVSREESPKQFLKFFGGKSLFDQTLHRALSLTSPDKIFISTSAKYFSLIQSIAKSIPAENIIKEPMRRDTAMAEGVGAAYIFHKDPDAVICNFPSDHLISPLSTFVQQMKQAAALAYETGQFVTLGVKPTRVHPGLGHIKAVKKFKHQPGVLVGEKFVEKPPLDVAKKYTSSGEYYWNAHLFTWKAKVFLQLLNKYAPKVYAQLPRLQKAIDTDNERQVLQQAFQMAPTLATDYAVAEKLRKFICIPTKFTWTDVGDWKEVWNHLPKDTQGNVIFSTKGDANFVGIDSKDNLLMLDKQLVSMVGLSNMLVVDTPDAILICPKDDAQAVKKIVEMLKEQGLTKYL